MSAATGFLRLGDLVLTPPLPALLSVLMVAGVAYLGWRVARALRGAQTEALDVAAGFVLAAAVLAAAVHALALAQLVAPPLMRSAGWAVAAAGAFALIRHGGRVARLVRAELAAAPAASRLERIAALLAALAVVGLIAAALGPPTDADSLDYHLGVPLEWLRHGGAVARPDWFTSRLVGVAESLSLLGLAAGTDSASALLQAGGLIAAAVALRSLASTPRDRVLAWLLVAACPAMAFLVPNQKPQILPAAATTVALVMAVRRFSSFGRAEAVMALGCVAFAAASKISFLLSVGVVAAVALAAALRSGRLGAALAIGAAAFALLLGPMLARNYAFFGDPISPFLEHFRASPDRAVVHFAGQLRSAGGAFTPGNLARAALGIFIPTRLGAVTATLGLGALAFIPALAAARGPRRARALLAAALACATMYVLLGQITSRFFLEPYLWAGAALLATPWTRLKELLFRGLALQAAGAAAVALYGAVTLFPGAWTAGWRDAVMSRRAAGYAEAQWLDRVLPPHAVLLTQRWYLALAPRRFVVNDPVIHDPGTWQAPNGADVARLAGLATTGGADTLVVFGHARDVVFRLSQACGRPVPMTGTTNGLMRFPLATRNPINKVEYDIRVFELDGCERIASPPPARGAAVP